MSSITGSSEANKILPSLIYICILWWQIGTMGATSAFNYSMDVLSKLFSPFCFDNLLHFRIHHMCWWRELYPCPNINLSSRNIVWLEVRGPSGPQLLVGGPSGRLDFVLRALCSPQFCDFSLRMASLRWQPGWWPSRSLFDNLGCDYET